MQQIHINGKWLGQKLTGTQRYASEMTEAIAAARCAELVLHVPAGAQPPRWAHRYGVDVRTAPVAGVVFEQLYLPVATAGGLLLNFAGPAPLLKRRQLVTMHDATPFRYPKTFRRTFVGFYFGMYALLSRTARQLVTVSEFSASELAAVLRVPVERFLVAGCAADSLCGIEPVRPDLDLPDDHYLVVVTAVARSGRHVIVVGLAGDQQVFNSTGSLSGHAIVPGRLSDAELVWLYQNSRALIFPSKYEGFGLPPLEAQMLGCPVVTSHAASLPEVCGDGALYFDPDDPATLIAQLDRLEADAGLADDLRHRGAVNAKRFSWTASAGKIVDWLRSA
jgi:glycosyltransferase involved in cell wall biosynthesis